MAGHLDPLCMVAGQGDGPRYAELHRQCPAGRVVRADGELIFVYRCACDCHQDNHQEGKAA